MNTLTTRLLRLTCTAIAAAWLGGVSAWGQSLLESFRSQCDTLSVLVKERTSVKAALKISSVKIRNGALDFYFTASLGDIPIGAEDVKWLKSTIKSLTPEKYRSYKIGSIFIGGLSINEFIAEAPGNDGSSHPNRWKPATIPPATTPLVTAEDGQHFPGGLSGRHLAMWQSHGKYYEESTRRWEWQRAPLFTTVEDMYTQSYVLPFLIPMLENAGAYVMTPRERDTQRHEVITDNDESFSFVREGNTRRLGKYEETGSWSDAGTGFADLKEVYMMSDNPFTSGTARKASCTRDKNGNAKAVWTPNIPERGNYAVYVSYKTLPNSTEHAHYSVHHSGGTSSFLVNQKMGGGTWIYLGTFEFDKGTNCCVTLDNGTAKGKSFKNGTCVTADAVKIGGGMGKFSRGNSDMTKDEYCISGVPAFAEGALYSMKWAGIDSTITKQHDKEYTNDYASRGAWVSMMTGGSYVNPKQEGKGIPIDLSLGFHTDAGTFPNDSIVGTLAIYTLKDEGSRKLPGGEDRMTARIMANDIQTQITNDVRAQFEPEWQRRQLWNRSYSESRTGGVPAMILELLSHQNFADMKYGLDPAFRFTVSRSIYKGILKYLSSRYGFDYVVQPLPVNSFSALIEEDGQVSLRWKATRDTLEATAAPTGFMLYTKVDSNAFDKGRIIEAEKTDDGGYEYKVSVWKGHQYSYKIVAFNEGGRSFPSETLSAGIPSSGYSPEKTVLVVNNFYRVSGPAWFDTPTYAGFDDKLDHGVPYMYGIERIGEMYQCRREVAWADDDCPGFGASYTDRAGEIVAGNTFDYPALHGSAILKAGYAFCSSSSDDFASNISRYSRFRMADIICGKQVTTPVGKGGVMPDKFHVFSKELRDALTEYCNGGGNVMISGANIGTDIWDKVYPVATDSTYQAEGRVFAEKILGYKWLTNYAGRKGLVRMMKTDKVVCQSLQVPFTFIRTPNPVIYNVESPDGLLPASSKAFTFLRYDDTGIPAGICNEGAGYRTACLGFPFEVIEDESVREELMKTLITWLRGK